MKKSIVDKKAERAVRLKAKGFTCEQIRKNMGLSSTSLVQYYLTRNKQYDSELAKYREENILLREKVIPMLDKIVEILT